MLLGALTLLGLVSVPLTGGRLWRLAHLRLRWLPVVAAAFAVQILIVNVIPGGDEDLRSAIHVGTYAVLAVVIARNLRLPGLPLIALGGLSNASAIVANGGVMPAREGALKTAGMTADPAEFTNSALVQDPNLWYLGDVFAVPSWVPAANVFSVGDLLLVAGAWVLMHSVCRTRLRLRRRPPEAAGLIVFDAEGVVETITPEAQRLVSFIDGIPATDPSLPAEAYLVAGRARTLARGAEAAPPRAEVLDSRGRWITLTASCTGPRTALSVST